MVIIQSKSGRLANRLLIFSHFIGNALENGYSLINPTFDEYRRFFKSTRDNNFGEYPISVETARNLPYPVFYWLTTLLKKYYSISDRYEFIQADKENQINMSHEDFVQKATQKTVFANGWFYRDYKNLAKHGTIIREFFEPDADVTGRINRLQNTIREKQDAVVGVHIRRGDYRKWNDGKFFFKDSVYSDRMKEIENQVNQNGKSVGFLLCSNEQINLDNYRDFNIYTAPGHMVDDLYSLSKCDYIIGPPSTYSMWASYHGQTFMKHIINKEQDMDLSTFTIKYRHT